MKKHIIYFLLIPLFFSCKQNRFDADISKIDVNVHIKRFEDELFHIDLDHMNKEINRLKKKYADFFPLFNHKIIEIGSSENPNYPELLKSYITDYSIYLSYKQVTEVYPDLNELEEKLTECFTYYKYYFPDKTVPDIITYISGFNQSVVTSENLIGISLDKYLGRDETLYKMISPPYPDYARFLMHKDKIPSDCMRAWATTEFEFNHSDDNLINNLIYEGKSMYFVKSMMPDENDTMIWGFTQEQMDFCKKEEKKMWSYLVENKLLFETDKFRINQFIKEGPFTKDFTPDSPARAAVWIGYQIINSYMNKHKELSLNALMNENNYRKILNESGYNP